MAFAIHSPYNNGITTNMNDMFSSLNNIFVTSTPRQAESSDARMNLRHHDPEYQRRRKNKKEQETEDPFDGNDTAIVSIEALNTFLDNFIKANGADLGVKKTVTGRDFEKSFKDGAGAPPSRKREQAAQAARIRRLVYIHYHLSSKVRRHHAWQFFGANDRYESPMCAFQHPQHIAKYSVTTLGAQQRAARDYKDKLKYP